MSVRKTFWMMAGAVAVIGASGVPNGVAAPGEETQTAGPVQDAPVTPMDDRVDGRRLASYSASWDQMLPDGSEWVSRAVISEELSVGEDDRWVRVQHTQQGPLEIAVRVELDQRTLQPISLHRTIANDVPEQVLDRLKQVGFAKELKIAFQETEYRVTTTDFNDETRETSGDMGMPYFDGSTLGLVIAALDLQPGAAARLPVLFVNGSDGAVTEYWVDALGAEDDEVAGLASVRVDVGWLDYESGVLTSEPGPLASGGAYWIAKDLRDSPAPVPRYKNESVDILLKGHG